MDAADTKGWAAKRSRWGDDPRMRCGTPVRQWLHVKHARCTSVDQWRSSGGRYPARDWRAAVTMTFGRWPPKWGVRRGRNPHSSRLASVVRQGWVPRRQTDRCPRPRPVRRRRGSVMSEPSSVASTGESSGDHRRVQRDYSYPPERSCARSHGRRSLCDGRSRPLAGPPQSLIPTRPRTKPTGSSAATTAPPRIVCPLTARRRRPTHPTPRTGGSGDRGGVRQLAPVCSSPRLGRPVSKAVARRLALDGHRTIRQSQPGADPGWPCALREAPSQARIRPTRPGKPKDHDQRP
jgi:hypothetical protein